MEKIILSGKRELDIYVNPQRQNLLRCMRIASIPLTPKGIADRIGVSASSVQHHIRKLLEIGVVELSHTEQVHGITAKYYRASHKTVQIGVLGKDGLMEERLALLQSILSRVFIGFSNYCAKESRIETVPRQRGDMLSGVIKLGKNEAHELYTIVRNFLDEHEHDGKEMESWEYALIAYPVTQANE